MRVSRLIVYDGGPEQLQKQLGMSMADGKKIIGAWGAPGNYLEITVITLGGSEGLDVFIAAEKAKQLAKEE